MFQEAVQAPYRAMTMAFFQGLLPVQEAKRIERKAVALLRHPSFPSRDFVAGGLFGSSAIIKRCLVVLGTMLADGAAWYLPSLVLATLAWTGAFHIDPMLRDRPWLRRLYWWLPPVLVAGLLLNRAISLLSLDPAHNEVALMLSDTSGISERLQVLFTGHGAIEGALLALLLFALGAHRLPSLRQTSDSTKAFVRVRLMVHNGFWVLLLMLLLLSMDAHTSLETLPSDPTVTIASWMKLGWVVLFTVLILMSGELIASTSHMALNHETSLLFQRATLKISLALPLCWWAVLQTEVFTDDWWSRPSQRSLDHAALVVVAYSTLVGWSYAPLTRTEGRFSHHVHNSTTLALGLVVMACVLFAGARDVALQIPVVGDGWVSASVAWRLTATTMLVGGVLMLLPSVGYDAAHRPESWWFRVGVLLTLSVGSAISSFVWILLPSLLLASSILLLLPWLVEVTHLGPPLRWSIVGFITLSFLFVLAADSPRAALIAAVVISALCRATEYGFVHRWASSLSDQKSL